MNKPPDETLKQGRNQSWLLVKCNECFSFIQNEPELIKCARRTEKYNFTKKPCSS